MAKLIAALALSASVLALVILATQETGALWRDQKSLGSATISSGSIDLTAGGADSVTLNGWTEDALKPTDVRQASFVLTNAGTSPLTYGMTSAVSGTPIGGLTVSASRMSAGAPASACDSATVAPGTALPLSSTPLIPLAAKTSERICLRAVVTAAATSGASYTATFTFSGQQA